MPRHLTFRDVYLKNEKPLPDDEDEYDPEVYTCKYCDSKSSVQNRSEGTVVCVDCGAVLVDRAVDHHSEWRTFQNDSSSAANQRVSLIADQHLMEEGQSGISLAQGQDGVGKGLSRAHHANSSSKDQRRREEAYKEITAIMERMGSPQDYIRRGKEVFLELDQAKKVRKSDIAVVAAAVVHFTCVEFKTGRTLREMATISGQDSSRIGKCVKIIQRVVRQEGFVRGQDVIPRILDRLQINTISRGTGKTPTVYEIERLLLQMFQLAKERVIQNAPQEASIAGAVFLLGLNRVKDRFFHRNIQQISEASGMAVSTIKNVAQSLSDNTHLFFPSPAPAWFETGEKN